MVFSWCSLGILEDYDPLYRAYIEISHRSALLGVHPIITWYTIYTLYIYTLDLPVRGSKWFGLKRVSSFHTLGFNWHPLVSVQVYIYIVGIYWVYYIIPPFGLGSKYWTLSGCGGGDLSFLGWGKNIPIQKGSLANSQHLFRCVKF